MKELLETLNLNNQIHALEKYFEGITHRLDKSKYKEYHVKKNTIVYENAITQMIQDYPSFEQNYTIENPCGDNNDTIKFSKITLATNKNSDYCLERIQLSFSEKHNQYKVSSISYRKENAHIHINLDQKNSVMFFNLKEGEIITAFMIKRNNNSFYIDREATNVSDDDDNYNNFHSIQVMNTIKNLYEKEDVLLFLNYFFKCQQLSKDQKDLFLIKNEIDIESITKNNIFSKSLTSFENSFSNLENQYDTKSFKNKQVI